MFTAFHALPPKTQVGLTLGVLGAIFATAIMAMVILTRSNLTGLEQGQMILLLTTIAGFMGTAWRESRNRKWAIEDRRQAADEQTNVIVAKAQAEATALLIATDAKAKVLHLETMAVAEKIRLETLRAAAALREDQRIVAENLTAKIQEVHKVAENAFNEANHVNLKIENLNQRLLQEAEKTNDDTAAKATDKKLDDIQQTADTIDAKVSGQAVKKLDEIKETAEDIDAKVDTLTERRGPAR